MGEENKANLPSLLLDLSGLASFLVDLPPGSLQKLRHEKDEYEAVQTELNNLGPELRASLGIEADIATIQEADARIKLIDEKHALALKQVEILEETRAKEVDRREKKISTICDKARIYTKDSGDSAALAALENTNSYRSQSADKGVKTRQKNAQGEEPTPTDKK